MNAASQPTPRAAAAREPDLAALVRRIAAGDAEALAELYDLTKALVFGLARQILRDEGAAEEATLDAYSQIWREAARWNPERGAVLPWIMNLARCRTIDRLRQMGGASRRLEQPLELAAASAAPDGSPADLSFVGERRRLVARALADLPADQREAIHCAFFLGMSHSEVASHLSQPLGTVKTRIRTGLSRLREHLQTLEAHA